MGQAQKGRGEGVNLSDLDYINLRNIGQSADFLCGNLDTWPFLVNLSCSRSWSNILSGIDMEMYSTHITFLLYSPRSISMHKRGSSTLEPSYAHPLDGHRSSV